MKFSSSSRHLLLIAGIAAFLMQAGSLVAADRERICINDDWRFIKGDPADQTANLTLLQARSGRRGAPTVTGQPVNDALWPYILASSNDFIKDPARKTVRPGVPFATDGIPYAAPTFDDSSWRQLNLPHDFGVDGQFLPSGTPGSSGGTGRLPFFGQVWYRKHLALAASEAGRQIYLEMDGAMSFAIVFVNGQLVGGWPYGYSSWQLDITPFVKPGTDNVIAIRLDNPPYSSRWYPGGGIYRNVWLTKTSPVHVGQWGTYAATPEATAASASLALRVTVENDDKQDAQAVVSTEIFELDARDKKIPNVVASMQPVTLRIPADSSAVADTKARISNPKLWGVGGKQKPNRYVAVTTIRQDGNVVDSYETPFGVRTLKFDPDNGFFLNGECVKMKGVCNHHDLGALGAAVNVRALQRQLEILQEMGCNALRTSHNPPAPELLDLCDKMGFLVMDESFDCWQRQKTPNDYHLLFDNWHEQDLRAMLRRDRNHPSIILWSIGNEVGEQSGDPNGIAQRLTQICHEEDPTRPTINAMNSASAKSAFTAPIDAIGLNYQGAGLNPVLRPPGAPQYPNFHKAFPDKLILGSETASTLSSRGFYAFPVASAPGTSAAANAGEEPGIRQVSSYDMYFAPWSYIPEKEWAAHERNPYVAGEFVWTGFDYLGEPTPFDQSRSSYFGIIDLAGFKKDRFYLYQSHWRPDLPMAHILPHWNWPDRVGKVTPVHVYTSGDEAEMFLNGQSLGRKKKGEFEYRLRWDDVVYLPGELKAVAYKNGKEWATDTVRTTGPADKLLLSPDRSTIAADGQDLSFVTLSVADKDGLVAPRSMNQIHFDISGPGEIIATDNGDPTDMTGFHSKDRKVFNGLALAIVKAKRGQTGVITLTAKSDGLTTATTTINLK